MVTNQAEEGAEGRLEMVSVYSPSLAEDWVDSRVIKEVGLV